MFKLIKNCNKVYRLSDTLFLHFARNRSAIHKMETINLCCAARAKTFSSMYADFRRVFSTLDNSTLTDAESASENAEPDIASILGENTDLECKLRVLILEVEVMRQEGRLVPENASMKTRNWQELLTMSTKSARRKYLEYLFKLEKKKENREYKKQQKRQDREENFKDKSDEDNDSLKYYLGHNQILLRVYDSTINNMYNSRLIQALQFGQKLVVDCGYNENMTTRENLLCAKQLMLLFAENRLHHEPFDLHFCNAALDSAQIKALYRHIPTLEEPWFPLNIQEKSYLDLFPKDKLVYLTPHCREIMTEFDHDAVYVVGAIVDKVNSEPLSLAKAKREGIRMAKFPLDNYLAWGAGSGKSLTINQVVSILLDIKRTGDWNYALRHVPRRKLADFSTNAAIQRTSRRLSYDKEISGHAKQQWKPIELEQLTYRRKSPKINQSPSATSRLINLRDINDA